MKRILFSLTLCLISSIGFAQVNYELKAGLNVSGIANTKGFGGHGWRPSAHFGISAAYDVAKRFSIAGDLLTTVKGFNNLHLSYLSVPVMVRYKISPKFAIEGGGGFGILLASFGIVDGKFDSFRDVWGNWFDAEVCAGLRYNLSSRLGLSLRYEHGLTNVIKKDAKITYVYLQPDDPLIGNQAGNLRAMGWKDYNRNFMISVYCRLKRNIK